jgi:hypothetical protein
MRAMTPATTATELQLVPPGTVVEANGEGDASKSPPRPAGVSGADGRHRNAGAGVAGSCHLGFGRRNQLGRDAAGQVPQRFYRGSTRMALDLTQNPEVRFIRARWQVNPWGRGRPAARFGFHVTARPA